MAVCFLSPVHDKSSHHSSQLDEVSGDSSSDDEESSREQRNLTPNGRLPHPRPSLAAVSVPQGKYLRLAWRARQNVLEVYNSAVCCDRRRAFVVPPNLPWLFNEPMFSTSLGCERSREEEHDTDANTMIAEVEAAVEEWLASLASLARATSSLKGSLCGHINQCTQVRSLLEI